MLLDDSKYNERYVRVPFINRGEFHSSSIKYFHMFVTHDEFQCLFNRQVNDDDLMHITDDELHNLKTQVKKRYVVIGTRVIVPGTEFSKKFYLTRKPMKHYKEQNPDDSKVIQKYLNKEKIYLVVLIEYSHELSKENCEKLLEMNTG